MVKKCQIKARPCIPTFIIRRERVVRSRPRVGVTSFDPEASTFEAHVSSTLYFRRRVSLTSLVVPEVPNVQQEELVDVVTLIPSSFAGGPYDTCLLLLYAEYVVRHVWE